MIGMDMSPEAMRDAVMTAYAAGKLPERVRFEITTAAVYARDVLSQEDTTSHRAALAMVTQSLEWLVIAQETADHMYEPCDQADPATCPVHVLWDQVNAREYGAGATSAGS